MEPLTIASFAFAAIQSEPGKKFIEATIGKVAEKFTETAIQKMNELREIIWNKLRGNPDAEKALQEAEAGSEAGIRDVASYLDMAMRRDELFAVQVKEAVRVIQQNQIQGNDGMIQNNYDSSTGYQVKNEGGENYFGNITINKT